MSNNYNPEWGRFINADNLVSTGQGLLTHNMYAYCNNNPVNLCDTTGTLPMLTQMLLGGAGLKSIENGIQPVTKATVVKSNNTNNAVKNVTSGSTSKAPDYSSALNAVVNQNIGIAEQKSPVIDIMWFKRQVDHNAPWDYKVEERWNECIDEPYLGLYGIFIWDGQAMNAEQFGNMHYGIIGTAMGYSATMLYMGGGYANKGLIGFMFTFPPYCGDSKEDHTWIKKGIKY